MVTKIATMCATKQKTALSKKKKSTKVMKVSLSVEIGVTLFGCLCGLERGLLLYLRITYFRVPTYLD